MWHSNVFALHLVGWFLVLLDGWVVHGHFLAALGVTMILYAMWKTR